MVKQWYQKLGYSKYPLDPRSNPNLVAVEDIEKKIVTYILQGNMCLLCGLTGSGKTSMLQKIMSSSQLKDFDFLYISADGIKKDRDITDLVKEKMSLLDKILFKKPKNLVILLDECQVASRNLTESIKSKWNEVYSSGDKVIHSVVVSQIQSRLTSNFSGSFMDRLGKRVIKMKKLQPSELKNVLTTRLKLGDSNLVDKFNVDALNLLVKSCSGSVRQLLEYTDTILREIDRLDSTALQEDSFKITKENVFTLLQESGLISGTKDSLNNKIEFKKIFNSQKLKKAVEMFEEFGVMDAVLLAEKMDVTFATSKKYIKQLQDEHAIMISHTEDKIKFYVLTPRMKHELVAD